ncbi:MAG: ABC transporter ATP-binding protein [Candidatus Nanopelagicales bacterium]|nr:ABC transporter ATP-binding protein [Candidatus Nanopelagicales bacterium]MDZ4249252.1 ABC transporter ATP-binding protein [Candidatus Nanopelagicales bacterium]
MTSTGDWAIETQDLRKQYGDLWAVDGVTISIARGECFAMLGPNGAGKTTTTEMLEGYRVPTSGTMAVLGLDPRHGGALLKSRIGIVLQSVRDLGDLTVSESVRHFAAYYPDSRDVDEVISAVGLAEKRDERNSRLSGGQRRRLDVALGLIGRPEILFLDEPTTGFDPQARRNFWDLIDSVKAEGTTILLTTHYLEEAEHLADRVAVIDSGKVIACDTPENLGGRQRGQARVTWLEGGASHVEYTSAPTGFVRKLMARFDGEIPELSVERPSLEDIYLEMIKHNDEMEATRAAS